jgi:hypothetical protein
VKVGDVVLSKDEDSGRLVYKPVTELFLNKVDYIRHLGLTDGSKLEVTWNHPIFVKGKGWMEVKDIRIGDSLVLSDSRVAIVLFNNTLSSPDTTVYNFEVADTHSYFVGESEVWVHNYPDLGGMFESIRGWESIAGREENADAFAKGAQFCSENPGACTREYYENLLTSYLYVSGGAELKLTGYLMKLPLFGEALFTVLIRNPKLAKPIIYALERMDINYKVEHEDRDGIEISFGNGPLKLKAKAAVTNKGKVKFGTGVSFGTREASEVKFNYNFKTGKIETKYKNKNIDVLNFPGGKQ